MDLVRSRIVPFAYISQQVKVELTIMQCDTHSFIVQSSEGEETIG